MKIKTEYYQSAVKKLPDSRQYIIGHQDEEQVVVYQAYKPAIASFAVANHYLGGSDYSYNRMSWIKPNFLWMMYRCGWAEKDNQERVLALWINKKALQDILSNAVLSSFNPQYYSSHEAWKNELNTRDVRLQWDPDHDPYGNKLTRRAIQLGLKGDMLKEFGKKQVNLVEDITEFVREQKQYLDKNQAEKLIVPVESILEINDSALKKRVGID